MDRFLIDLWSMMIDLKPIDRGTTHSYVLLFAAGCGIVGLLIVLLDLCVIVTAKANSPFGLAHGWKKTPILIIFWPLGAAITGYIGSLLQIFQPTVLACATAGAAWHFGVKKIASQSRANIEEEEVDTGEVEK